MGLFLWQSKNTKIINNTYGIIQSKTFGAPAVSSNISNQLFKQNIVKDEIVGAGVAGM